jgi:CRISPR-associated protein Cas1
VSVDNLTLSRLLKTRELAQFLVEKKKLIDFNKLEYKIERQDSEDIKHKIRAYTIQNGEKYGIF